MAAHRPPTVDKALVDLLTTYQELNGSQIDELDETPSPLEFMKYVAKNQPFVVRGAASAWPAVQLWNVDYLAKVMANAMVKVAITPSGNADSVARNSEDGLMYFVKPLEVDEPFPDFLHYVREQEKGIHEATNVKYAQSQNDNLRGEYASLYKDVDQDVPWARVAFDQPPDAINLWIGNSNSITALHKDNYENIYYQIIGSKQFVLLPPPETACINEKSLPSATYALKSNSRPESGEMVIVPDKPGDVIPFATWDPDNPKEQEGPFSYLSRPIRVWLDAGDLLYLPALWYHKVSQRCSAEGISCAVNYWYDMDFGGMLYPSSTFIRDVCLAMTSKDLLPDTGTM